MKEKYNMLPEPIKSGLDLALTLTTFALAMYGLNAIVDSENRLTAAKATKDSPPTDEYKCDLNSYPLDMACWYKTEEYLCDGQNTIFDRTDDVCETIEYWNYRPPINYFR